MPTTINENIPRQESWEKVTGEAKYTADFPETGFLHARLYTSPHAHAKIISIDTTEALTVKGVIQIITGEDYPVLSGPLYEDRPPLAKDIVRYAGEPVAVVVADNEAAALAAVRKMNVTYKPLPEVFSPSQALADDAPVLHPNLVLYNKVVDDIYPGQLTNINASFHIEKGSVAAGFDKSDVIIEKTYTLPPSDHLAMEVRAVTASIARDGTVTITSATQAPYTVVKQIASSFCLPAGKIQVTVPYVGGGFGGKAPVMTELLAYIASHKCGGRPVKLTLTREQDMLSAPCRLGLEAAVKLGAAADGQIMAAQLTYYLDCGAYADIAPYMTKAMAADCTGPYDIKNLVCDAFCVYTNHTYATSYRSFAHESYTYCIERAMDELAKKCGISPFDIRLKNAIYPGCYSPTRVLTTASNSGNISLCLQKLSDALARRNDAKRNANKVYATGISCFWKAANPPINAVSGAFITFNADGSLNLNTGVVEMGSGSQSMLAQMLADKLQMDISQIHVCMDVQTRLNPEHYKTVASLTTYMAGRAVMRAADDIITQLKNLGAAALSCLPEEIEIADSQVYSRQNPASSIAFKDIVDGYLSPDKKNTGEPVLAKGSFVLKGLTPLNKENGKGKSGPAWTPGAQAVEIEFDKEDLTYRIINAYTVMDVGKIINEKAIQESIRGGMAMGLSMASREQYSYNSSGRLSTPNLRSYKLLHIGQEPEYYVELVETPQEDSPYGTRSMSEHGITGIPAALANALSKATGIDIDTLPVTPEYIYHHMRKEPEL